nr:MAG TPA: hypothetical protein [Microviridae sp.]
MLFLVWISLFYSVRAYYTRVRYYPNGKSLRGV